MRLPAWLAALLVLGWSAMVWMVLGSDDPPVKASFPGSGLLFNAGHAALFGAEAFLLGCLVAPGRVRAPTAGRWLAVAVVAFVYSALLEWRQAGLEHRTGSVADLLTNAVGAFGMPWALSVERAPWTSRTAWVVAASLVSATLAETTGW